MALFLLGLVLAAGPLAQNPSAPRSPAMVRAAFKQLIDRPRVPLEPREAAATTAPDGTVTQTLSIVSERKRDGALERVPLLVVKPAQPAGRRPAVIVMHGTGSNKESQRDWLAKLAARGIIGVSIDARYHGERAGGAKGADAYNAAITAAWRAPAKSQEHPFFYDTVWDLGRVVDYLISRPDVDAKNLGMLGFSMGGIQAWLAAAVDPRVKVVVPAIAVQSFRFSLEHDKWQGRAKTIAAVHEAAAKDLGEPAVNARVCRALWSKLIPGILDDFDAPSMLRLIAPRPLLILNGELDPNCPIEGAQIAIAAAQAAYKAAKSPDKLEVIIAPGVAHKVTDAQNAAALDWLSRHLR